jgi:hypothetical protein
MTDDGPSVTDRPDTDTPVTDLGGDVYDLTLTREPARYRAYLFDWDRPTLVDRDLAVMGDAMLGADWRGLPAGYVLLSPGADANPPTASVGDFR